MKKNEQEKSKSEKKGFSGKNHFTDKEKFLNSIQRVVFLEC